MSVAIDRGAAPCLIRTQDPPDTMDDLVRAVERGVRVAADDLGLDLSPARWRSRMPEDLVESDLDHRDALSEPLTALAEQARMSIEGWGRTGAVLLWDDATPELVLKLVDVLGPWGLGKRAARIPVVISIGPEGVRESPVRDLFERRSLTAWMRVRMLRPFEEGGEDLLAYEFALLAGEDERPPLAFVDGERQQLDSLYNQLRRSFGGVPGRFVHSDSLRMIAEFGENMKLLVPVDDSKP